MGTGLVLISMTTVIVVTIGAWTYWILQTRNGTKRIHCDSKNLANDTKCHAVLYLSMQPSRDNKRIKKRSYKLFDQKKQGQENIINHKSFKPKNEKVIILKEFRKEKNKALNKKAKSLPKVMGTGEVRKINTSSKLWWI